MFFDLNVPIPALQSLATTAQSKKGKAVAKQSHAQQSESTFSSAQVAAIENRVELLIHRPSRAHRVLFFPQLIITQLDTRSLRLTRLYIRNLIRKLIKTLPTLS